MTRWPRHPRTADAAGDAGAGDVPGPEPGPTGVFGAATKGIALASLVLAVGVESWLGRVVWAPLPFAVALAAAAGFAGGRLAPWPASAAVLFLTYLTPLAALATVGRFSVELLLVWSAALTGTIVADPHRWKWTYPPGWQLPLVLWALTVAVAWPITALREADFTSLSLLQRYNVPNTSIGGSPGVVITWAIDSAIIHLLGLLWFNWLFARAGRLTEAEFRRWMAWPLAGSAVTGSLLAVYQGVFDLTFLSVGVWAVLDRASGSLLDANASGMVAALWSAGLLALAGRSVRSRAPVFAAIAVCWVGVWMSGSRTALGTACTALVTVGISMYARSTSVRMRIGVLATGAMAAALLATAFLAEPADSQNPLSRLKRTLPADLSRGQVTWTLREMWNRNGYGTAATGLIARRPITGVGLGGFNLQGAAYHSFPGGHPPPDNAQNWWRHHVAELGFLGAAGLIAWTFVFGRFLWRTAGTGERRVAAAAIKGGIVGLALTSFVGMPAQSLPVAMTFWALAYWYTRLVVPERTPVAAWVPGPVAWTLLAAFVLSYGGVLLVLARGADRPAMRAAAGGWRYTYGIYDPGARGDELTNLRWTERKGVTVVPNDSEWMVLTVRAEHPDLHERPVRARVVVNGRAVVDTTLHTDAPITRVVNTGPSERAIIETRVDRTWRPADLPPLHPDVGLVISWRFTTDPSGLPAVTAPLRR